VKSDSRRRSGQARRVWSSAASPVRSTQLENRPQEVELKEHVEHLPPDPRRKLSDLPAAGLRSVRSRMASRLSISILQIVAYEDYIYAILRGSEKRLEDSYSVLLPILPGPLNFPTF